MSSIIRGSDNIDSAVVVEMSGSVTDNSVARFDGTTGKVQNSSVTIDDNGNVGIGITPDATCKIYAVGSQQTIRIESTISSDAVFRSTTTLGDWGAGTGIGVASNEYTI